MGLRISWAPFGARRRLAGIMASKTKNLLTGKSESELYLPIKRLLQGQGYVVKSEIASADVVACRGDEEPVIIELKTSFSLTLVHQAIERQAVTDLVYVAVFHKSGRSFYQSLKRHKALCRRLGIGLLTVELVHGDVQIHLDPGPYTPRKSKTKKARLLKEFAHRVGDPNTGGQTSAGVVTAYRQKAIRCAWLLHQQGACKTSVVRTGAGVPRATQIMSANHYGWFERVSHGVYELSPKGKQAALDFDQETLDSLRLV